MTDPLLSLIQARLDRVSERLTRLNERIELFDKLIEDAVREEREACALIAETWYGLADEVAADIVGRIRARGENNAQG